jgi:hypothetical protein
VALASIATDTDQDIDITGALREVSVIRGLLERFSKIEACHTRIDKENTTAPHTCCRSQRRHPRGVAPPGFDPLSVERPRQGAEAQCAPPL